MPTPPKPLEVLKSEKKSHRTQAELEQRRKGEAATLTGQKMQEHQTTKSNPAAHRQFLRLRKMLALIGKDDSLYEAVINRYCVLTAECADMEKDRRDIVDEQTQLEGWLFCGEIEPKEYYEKNDELIGKKMMIEKMLNPKRKMLLDIEKENIMTIAAALRSIPKKPQEDEDEDRMANMLDRRMRLV